MHHRVALLVSAALGGAILLLFGCPTTPDPDEGNHGNANTATPGNGNTGPGGTESTNDPPVEAMLPRGWEPVQRDGADPEFLLIAGSGGTEVAAVEQARVEAAKLRETEVTGESVRAFVAGLDAQTGDMVERVSYGSTVISRTNQRIREAEPYGNTVEMDLGDELTVFWARVRVSEFHLFPAQALRDLIAEAPGAGEARDAWLERLRVLGEQYLASGEYAFAIAAYATRARASENPEHYLEVVRLLIEHDMLGYALRTLEIAGSYADVAESAEYQRLHTLISSRLEDTWNRFEDGVIQAARSRQIPSTFSVTYDGAAVTRCEAPFSFTVHSDAPRHLILLWVDDDGVFRWPMEVPGDQTFQGERDINGTGSTVPGATTVVAVATDTPVYDAEIIPADGLWREHALAGDSETLVAMDTIYEYLLNLLAREDACTAMHTFTFR